MKSIIIIPARMESNRLPNKPLLVLPASGMPLLWHTYQQAKKTKADHVIVTSPDQSVGRWCSANGVNFFPSSRECPTGTHRCADVAAKLKMPPSRLINWQCDEPLLNPHWVDSLLPGEDLTEQKPVETIACPIFDPGVYHNAHQVKVRFDIWEKALDFTRAGLIGAYEHVGVYSFSPKFLTDVPRPTDLSIKEGLEQLSWLEHRIEIQLSIRPGPAPLSINTEEDLEKFNEILARSNQDETS